MSYTSEEAYGRIMAAPDLEWLDVNWQMEELDLAQAGVPTHTTRARLRFKLVASGEISSKGWIIDEVSVVGDVPYWQVYLPLVIR